MKIQLKLYASLRRFLPDVDIGEPTEVEVPDQVTIANIISRFKIPLEECHIILVNGNRTTAETILQPDDVVVIFPPMGGG